MATRDLDDLLREDDSDTDDQILSPHKSINVDQIMDSDDEEITRVAVSTAASPVPFVLSAPKAAAQSTSATQSASASATATGLPLPASAGPDASSSDDDGPAAKPQTYEEILQYILSLPDPDDLDNPYDDLDEMPTVALEAVAGSLSPTIAKIELVAGDGHVPDNAASTPSVPKHVPSNVSCMHGHHSGVGLWATAGGLAATRRFAARVPAGMPARSLQRAARGDAIAHQAQANDHHRRASNSSRCAFQRYVVLLLFLFVLFFVFLLRLTRH